MNVNLYSCKSKFTSYVSADVSPESFRRGLVRGRNPGVARAGPEPPVHVDRLKLALLASLALEVALAARRVDSRDVVCEIQRILCYEVPIELWSYID